MRFGQWPGLAVDGDLALLHRLEQGGLASRWSPVQLVEQHDVRENRARHESPRYPRMAENTETPVMSEGSRSGWPWIRARRVPIETATAFASMVFPTPGTSSMSRLPCGENSGSRRDDCVWSTEHDGAQIRL